MGSQHVKTGIGAIGEKGSTSRRHTRKPWVRYPHLAKKSKEERRGERTTSQRKGSEKRKRRAREEKLSSGSRQKRCVDNTMAGQRRRVVFHPENSRKKKTIREGFGLLRTASPTDRRECEATGGTASAKNARIRAQACREKGRQEGLS